MNLFTKIAKIRRKQRQRIYNRAYRQAMKHLKREFKAESDRHVQAEKELEKYYRKDVDTEAKKTRKKIQELENYKLLLERKEMELESKLAFLNDQLHKIEELKARMDGAVNLMARAGSLSNGAIDDAEKIKLALKKVL
ncbi:hypothetical protein EHO60_12395 [Leptospira fletcheri]|uniref:Uncharacterized protein n=1 Tax=Leptospira fletcheri TaxID=2484981 RepID=A0A4R9GCU0_9LEPT|nr:hypothetical protein [Leptospira fletcheri]TGK08837.1 hypothetical protein EHO60_12395 [Leptospira fletcheri]